MRLKDKIRLKIQKYLGVDVLSDSLNDYCKYLNENIVQLDINIETIGDMIKTLEECCKFHTKNLNSHTKDINKLLSTVNGNSEDISLLHNTIRNVVSVGADIVPNVNSRERSWAVFCIEGNYNIVKFIDLHGQDYRNIINYLKQFEGSRMCIDAPNPRMFEEMFKMK